MLIHNICSCHSSQEAQHHLQRNLHSELAHFNNRCILSAIFSLCNSKMNYSKFYWTLLIFSKLLMMY